MSEVVRSGIGSVHRGQFEAAKSQGFSPVQTMTLIILPQAMRIILPPLAVQAANLVKNTSVLALIAGGELMYFANSFAGDTSYYGPAYVAAAVLYFAICFPLSRAAVYLERRMGTHRHVATGDATEELAADAVEVTPGTHDITGHAAAQAIRALARADAATIPIFAMTADAFVEDEKAALAAGMNAHVAKPLEIDELRRAVDRFVEKGRS